jgi:hypothetical protein
MPRLMEFNLAPHNPDARPPGEVRITSISARPYGDGRRILLHVQLTPFEERPSVHVEATTPSGRIAGSLSIIESDSPELELTLHLRGEIEPGVHHIQAFLQYGDQPPQDHAETSVVVEPPSTYY